MLFKNVDVSTVLFCLWSTSLLKLKLFFMCTLAQRAGLWSLYLLINCTSCLSCHKLVEERIYGTIGPSTTWSISRVFRFCTGTVQNLQYASIQHLSIRTSSTCTCSFMIGRTVLSDKAEDIDISVLEMRNCLLAFNAPLA